MPRLDHRPGLETFAYETQLVMGLLVPMMNQVREHVGMPRLTAQQVRHLVREYVREHPRPPRQGG